MKKTDKKICAGHFSEWLAMVRHALQNNSGIDVDCGDCVGCCSSSYFIHITPDDKDAQAHIPKEILFPAPGLKGHFVLGFDQDGKCPMLVNSKCIIYEHRPLTCRQYDCRVFPATGLNLDNDEKPIINHQLKRWQFKFPKKRDQLEFDAAHTAAKFLRENAELFPGDFIPRNTTQLAVLAIKVCDVFMKLEKPGKTGPATDQEIVKAVMKAWKQVENDS